MLAVICFARKGSIRIPEKNMKLLHDTPLIEYTLKTMKYIFNKLNCPCYILTDWNKISEKSKEYDIETIWRGHPKEWDDIKLNIWAHEKINADYYVLLQPTNPNRNNEQILRWIGACLKNNYKSAFSATRQNRNTYIMNGNFYFYDKNQLLKSDLIDDESRIFIEENKIIDLDTLKDWEEAEAYYANKNNS
jgi:CMP-N-acetylneuraminic acid synthetase